MPIYPLLGVIFFPFLFFSLFSKRSEAARNYFARGPTPVADRSFATHTPASDYPSPTLAFPANKRPTRFVLAE